MPNSQSVDLADLSICDREPITRLDKIQSFGFMLAMANDWTIVRASANTRELLGIGADSLIGNSLDSAIGREALHIIRNATTVLQAGLSERLYDLALVSRTSRFDLNLHYCGDLLILEGEPTVPQDRLEGASMVRAMIARLNSIESLPGFHRDAARQVRAITGFDRVMIYRFDDNGDGNVIAESMRSGMESFHGLRFPASDIPAQARLLYLQNPFRIIVDVQSDPVPILPLRAGPGQAIDLSHAVTRAVSPVHIEYLRNMDVGASLSISIIVDGALWGLIACHHKSARRPSFVMRTAAELFGHMYSLTLESRLRGNSTLDERTARALADRLITSLAADEDLLGNAEWVRSALAGMIECDGVAVVSRGTVTRNGSAPALEDVLALARFLNTESPSAVFATDCLARILPSAGDPGPLVAGMLAIPVSRVPRDYLMLFRRELIEEVRWGGDPAKAMLPADDGKRLSPRKSFAAYVEMVRGKCTPFSDRDRRIGEAVRLALIEVILRYSEAAADERRRTGERSELLVAELNHRVRNILTLIRGLISRTSRDSGGVSQYVTSLSGRIHALARAHDYVTRHSWGPASLTALIEDEVNSFRRDGQEVLTLEGGKALLEPVAISTMALVIHELATNSAKYGALSTASGTIQVRLVAQEDRSLTIEWRERGGPAVRPPARRGFGSAIVERTVPFDLQGTAEVRYAADGLEADFSIPARHVIIPDETPELLDDRPAAIAEPPPPPRAPGPMPLEGETVLLLEDNMIIALETEDMVCELGAADVIAASTIADAETALGDHKVSFAVLDINIGGRTSFALARKLRTAGIPFLFASGYGDQVPLADDQAGAVILQKPFDSEQLHRAVDTLVGSRVRQD